MENPFELILINSIIENLLRIVKKDHKITVPIAEVFNLNQAAEYVSLSKSAIYKKTSERNIPHFKKGKKLYFKRSELDEWLTEYKISTHAEIDKEAGNYFLGKKRILKHKLSE
ncbi:MAG: helix-turn-helix domain-containing protein [Chitinophagaceae bacterium]|nr:helix-turn-helix domain-containing protein [Chitinophagaceae bacterium]